MLLAKSPVSAHREVVACLLRFWGLAVRNWLLALVFGGVVAVSFAIAYLLVPDYHSIANFRLLAVKSERNGQGQMVWTYTQTKPAIGDQIIYIPVHAGRLSIAVNGDDFGQTGLNDAARISRRKLPTLVAIPLQRLSGKSPSLIVVTQLDHDVGTAPDPVYLGPAAQLAPVSDKHFAVGPPMRASIPAMATFMALLTLIISFLSRAPARYLCLTGMFTLQVLLELDDQIAWGSYSLRAAAPFLAIYRDLLLFYSFNLWYGGQASHRKLALWVALVCTGLLILGEVALVSAAQTKFIIFVARSLAVCTNCVYVILNSKSMTEKAQKITLALFGVWMTSNLTYLAFYKPSGNPSRDFIAANYVNVSTVLALSALVLGGMAIEWSRYRRALVNQADLGAIASGNRLALDERTRELKQEIEKRAVLEERERFTRDLHDGISGQLLSLLLQARRGQLDPADVERGVSQSLADLRLVTASIDTADEGIAASLHAFRERASQQLAIADIALDWHEDAGIEAISLPSGVTLDILRAMQEAVTNVIRHAGAKDMIVTVRGAVDDNALVITLADNGCGFAEQPERMGNGLKNMRHRIMRSGGNLSVAAGAKGVGTAITFSVPTNQSS